MFDQECILENCLATLSSDKPFLEFELGLSSKELSLFDNITVENDKMSFMPYSGNISSLSIAFNKFLDYASAKNEEISSQGANLMANLVDNIFQKMHTKHVWLAFVASKAFNKPVRWHTDVSFRYDAATNRSGLSMDINETECGLEKEYFVLFTLKGASTLFYKFDNNYRDELIHYYKTYDYATTQNKIKAMLDGEKILEGKTAKGYVSLNGLQYGALHTRPAYSEERIFLAFGSIDEQSLKFFSK